MKDKIFFSVIIPAYNREKELPIAIDSVLSQTHGDFEVIVVDNGSTDKTRDLLQRYINKDKRVKYFWQENSGSPAGSRNTGIKNSNYDWVCLLDSDDYWLPTKLEEVAKVIRNHPDVIAVSHFENRMVNGQFDRILAHGLGLSEPLFECLLFEGNKFSTSAMSIRKKELMEAGLFDTRKSYFIVEDYDLWLKLAKLGRFYSIEKVLGAFCISGSNMSGNIELTNTNLKILVLDYIDSLGLKNSQQLKRIHGARIDYYKGRSYQMAGQFNKAVPILLSSIKGYPLAVKKYISLGFALLHIKR